MCVCPCGLLSFQTRARHSWAVAVETGVALLNQCQCEHAHPHGNPVKAGSVWRTGMLNRGWFRMGATMASTHRQAFTGSRIQLPQAGKHKASAKGDRCRSTTGNTDKSISHIKEHCCGIINGLRKPCSLPLQCCAKNINTAWIKSRITTSWLSAYAIHSHCN